jgi:hypothetical protein
MIFHPVFIGSAQGSRKDRILSIRYGSSQIITPKRGIAIPASMSKCSSRVPQANNIITAVPAIDTAVPKSGSRMISPKKPAVTATGGMTPFQKPFIDCGREAA